MFVECGLEKLAAGQVMMPGYGFRGSPKASYPVGWNSSELIRGPLEALFQLPHDGLSSMKSGAVKGFPHIASLFLLGVALPKTSLTSLFYTSLHSLSFVHV